MLTEQKITWNKADYLWNDFKLGDQYIQYLRDTYGVIVNSSFSSGFSSGLDTVAGRAIWGYVFNLIEVEISLGGAGPEYMPGGIKKKLEKKKIKLIFIMDDIRNEISKDVKKIVPIKAVTDIQNKIEEITKTKISLRDVQIIKG